MMHQDPARNRQDNDSLQPYEEALKTRVPSRNELLAEAKAFSARQRRRKQTLAGAFPCWR